MSRKEQSARRRYAGFRVYVPISLFLRSVTFLVFQNVVRATLRLRQRTQPHSLMSNPHITWPASGDYLVGPCSILIWEAPPQGGAISSKFS